MRWPFLDLTVDDQGFYRSSDRWPAVVATIATGIVIVLDRIVGAGQSREFEHASPADRSATQDTPLDRSPCLGARSKRTKWLAACI